MQQYNPILFVVQNASDARRFCFSDADATDTKSRVKTLTCVDRVYIRCTYIHEKGDIVTLRCKLQKRLVATIQNIPMGKNAFNFRLFRGWLAIILAISNFDLVVDTSRTCFCSSFPVCDAKVSFSVQKQISQRAKVRLSKTRERILQKLEVGSWKFKAVDSVRGGRGY